jgi:hypothetical protein
MTNNERTRNRYPGVCMGGFWNYMGEGQMDDCERKREGVRYNKTSPVRRVWRD